MTRLGLWPAAAVFDSQPEVLGIVTKATAEQIQATDVVGIGPDADADDDRLAVNESERVEVDRRQAHPVDRSPLAGHQPALEDAKL